MKKLTFLQKIRSLKDYEVIDLMIDAIEKPVIELDFNYFRDYHFGDNKKIVCTGCASTNLLYKLTSKPRNTNKNLLNKNNFMEYDITFDSKRLRISIPIIDFFQKAIDNLSVGNIKNYNFYAKILNMPILIETYLPELNNKTWKDNINAYKQYAELLKSKHKTDDIFAKN